MWGQFARSGSDVIFWTNALEAVAPARCAVVEWRRRAEISFHPKSAFPGPVIPVSGGPYPFRAGTEEKMDAYTKIMNRIVPLTEVRMRSLKRDPCLKDLVDQISLRSNFLQKNTASLEAATLRAAFRGVEVTDSGLSWPFAFAVPNWMVTATQADLFDANQAISRPYSVTFSEGSTILSENIARAEVVGLAMTREELAHFLAGKNQAEAKKPTQKEQRHLTWRDLMVFELELSDYDPIESLNALRTRSERRIPSEEEGAEPAGVKPRRTPLEGLLRLFVHAIWLSGMRPTEVWGSRLLVPKPNLIWTPELRDFLRNHPAEAIIEGIAVPVEWLVKSSGESVSRTAHMAIEQTGAPAILMIRSAKQTNANADLKREMRLQILENIPIRHLNMLAIATQLRHLQLDWKVQDQIRSSMTKILKRIARDSETLKGMNINLYSFRHSFATRVKKVLPPHEAAALTGHTALSSLYVYGEFRAMKSSRSGGKPQDWIPAADPARAKLLQEGWERSPEQKAPALSPPAG